MARRRKRRRSRPKTRIVYRNKKVRRRRRNPSIGGVLGSLEPIIMTVAGMKGVQLLANKVLKMGPVKIGSDGTPSKNYMGPLASFLVGLAVQTYGKKFIGKKIADAIGAGAMIQGLSTVVDLVLMKEQEFQAIAGLAKDGNLYFLEGLGQGNYEQIDYSHLMEPDVSTSVSGVSGVSGLSNAYEKIN